MSWIRESQRSWLERFCINVLKCGPIPQHVAFIMDGNRRYAKKLSVQSIRGQIQGFEKLTETLEWCFDLGIKEVTLYAFSIENFKRPQSEVDGLMTLACEKFQQLLKDKEKLEKYGVCVKIIGNLTLLPVDLQQLVAEVMLLTEHNDRAFLSVCLAYTSREEITHSVNEIADGVKSGYLLPSDISEELIENCLYTSREPDLLLRTSGETRLSDFLLWQSSFSVLSFIKVLWPEFNIWYLFAAILHYQQNCKAVKRAKEENISFRNTRKAEEDFKVASEYYKEKNVVGDTDFLIPTHELEETKKQREERITNFLKYLEEKRHQQLLRLKAGLTEQVAWSKYSF